MLFIAGVVSLIDDNGDKVIFDENQRFLKIPKTLADEYVDQSSCPVLLNHKSQHQIGRTRSFGIGTCSNNQSVLYGQLIIDNADFLAALRAVTERYYEGRSICSLDGFVAPTAEEGKDITAFTAIMQRLPGLSLGHNSDSLKIEEVSLCVTGAREGAVISSVSYKKPDREPEVNEEKKREFIEALAAFHNISNIDKLTKLQRDFKFVGHAPEELFMYNSHPAEILTMSTKTDDDSNNDAYTMNPSNTTPLEPFIQSQKDMMEKLTELNHRLKTRNPFDETNYPGHTRRREDEVEEFQPWKRRHYSKRPYDATDESRMEYDDADFFPAQLHAFNRSKRRYYDTVDEMDSPLTGPIRKRFRGRRPRAHRPLYKEEREERDREEEEKDEQDEDEDEIERKTREEKQLLRRERKKLREDQQSLHEQQLKHIKTEQDLLQQKMLAFNQMQQQLQQQQQQQQQQSQPQQSQQRPQQMSMELDAPPVSSPPLNESEKLMEAPAEQGIVSDPPSVSNQQYSLTGKEYSGKTVGEHLMALV